MRTSATRLRASPSRRERASADVVLISMPFALLPQPSIALGLLKATLKPISCRVLYFTFRFADLVGKRLYSWIAAGSPSTTQFLGDWLFRPSLFPTATHDDRAFLESLIRKGIWTATPGDVANRVREVRRQIDPYLEECVAEVLAHEPRMFGFTSVFQQHVASLALARRLKRADPDIFIVFGGANCEGAMGREMMKRFDFLDAVVSGEGEVVLPELVERVLAGKSVADLEGVSSRAATETALGNGGNASRVAHLDELPYPDYSDFFAALRDSGVCRELEPTLSFETSRGCWWGEKEHCTFCGLNGTSMAFRSKSADRAMRELESLLVSYPVSQVQVVDNILDMRYFKTFIPDLARKNLPVEFFYEVKANLGKQQLRLLKAAGITRIQPGIESLSTPVLAAMAKGVTLLQNLRLLKWCLEIGIRPLWNIIWGFPQESPEDYERMTRLMPWLSHLEPPLFAGQIRLDRFSPNYDRSAEYGFTNVRPDPAYVHLYPFEESSLANLAYYFEFDYQDGRDIESYVEPARRAIVEWRKNHRRSALFFLDKNDQLMIWDWRPAARSQTTLLQGDDRALYLACDEIRSVAQLTRLFRQQGSGSSPLEVEERIQPLVDAGLMAREDDKVLSLAVRHSAALASRPSDGAGVSPESGP